MLALPVENNKHTNLHSEFKLFGVHYKGSVHIGLEWKIRNKFNNYSNSAMGVPLADVLRGYGGASPPLTVSPSLDVFDDPDDEYETLPFEETVPTGDTIDVPPPRSSASLATCLGNCIDGRPSNSRGDAAE